MSKPSVSVENVSKKFGLTLKNALKYGIIDSLRRTVGLGKGESLRRGEFWALKDVSFELNPGDALGIMGVNGSGKTTLLRILNGTYSPDHGKVTMRGRLGALIAAGAGFSPMLTGRENVFISGALLGMTSREIRRRFDEIVAFSELEEFIDMPVRNYSSGMSVRLGFAVAVLGTPDVLLVDEVLAVGDINFQKKCFERIHALRKRGTTILLVSHSVGGVWAVCTKGLFINKGMGSGILSVEEAIRLYEKANYEAALASMGRGKALGSGAERLNDGSIGTGEIVLERLEICDAVTGDSKTHFEFGEALQFSLCINARDRIEQLTMNYTIDSVQYRFVVSSMNTYSEGMGMPDIEPGRHEITTVIPKQSLRPGVYSVNLSIARKPQGVPIFFKNKIATFMIKPNENVFFMDVEVPAIVHFDASYEFRKIG